MFSMFTFVITRWLFTIRTCERRPVWLLITESWFCDVYLLDIVTLLVIFIIFRLMVFTVIILIKLGVIFIFRLIVWFTRRTIRSVLWLWTSWRSWRDSVWVGR